MTGQKKYNRTELLDRAIELFRRQGYAGTSTAELVAELGVNRKSMYAEFGSKQELFEAALERYSEVNLSRVLAPIEDDDAGADAIHMAFAGYASASEGSFSGLGCLMANTAVERATLDPGSAQYVDAYLSRLTTGFRRALNNAQAEDKLATGANLDELADFMAMAVVGISALIRAKVSPAQVHAAARVVTAQLRT